MQDAPNFSAWNQETLARFATEQYQQNIDLRTAMEQLRLDLKDAMQELRKYKKEWK